MMKRCIVLGLVFLVLLMFVSTCSASFLSSNNRLQDRLKENTVFKKIMDRFSQALSSSESIGSKDVDEDDASVSEPVDVSDEDSAEDIDGNYDAGGWVVAGDSDVGSDVNPKIPDQKRITMIDRVVNIIMVHNEKVARVIQRVIEIIEVRTYASEMTQAEGTVDETVDNIVIGSEGTAGNIIDNIVVVGSSESLTSE